jgi:hypothetical protein
MTAPGGVLEQAPQAVLDNTSDLDDLWCDTCDPTANRAICGAQLDGDPYEACLDGECSHLHCIVCADLAPTHACTFPARVRP